MSRHPYYTDQGVTLYAGDALDVLADLPADSAHCVVTSPPYWGLRDYGTGTWQGGDPSCDHARDAQHRCRRCGSRCQDAQYGLESTFQAYVDNLRAVARELHRVLVDTGSLWLNLGDCFASAPPGRTAAPMRKSTLNGIESVRARRELVRAAGANRLAALPMKNLMGIPWRVALALQADGWILRNAIVWHKPNGMPESVRDRISCRYEMLFLLVKQRRYWFDLDAVRVPLTGRGTRRAGGRGPTSRPTGQRRDTTPAAGKESGRRLESADQTAP